jgi:putative transposase
VAVGTENFLPLPPPSQSHQPPTHFGLRLGPQRHEFQKVIPRSLSSIVRGYKIGVTKWVRTNTMTHQLWQRNLYEHIVRDYESYKRIANYIRNNPANWEEDKFYSL